MREHPPGMFDDMDKETIRQLFRLLADDEHSLDSVNLDTMSAEELYDKIVERGYNIPNFILASIMFTSLLFSTVLRLSPTRILDQIDDAFDFVNHQADLKNMEEETLKDIESL